MATSTYFGWAEPDDTDLVKNGAAAMRTLGNAIDSTVYNLNGRNPILNSNFSVWQRGTSFTVSSSAFTYIADRWQIYRAATGCTVTRQATSDTTNLPNIQYAMRIARDSGNTSTSIIYTAQSMESINSIPFAGKQVTFSFYARAGANYSAASGTLNAYLYSGTGTDQNVLSSGYTGQTAVVSLPATLTTTWQRFTGTGTIAATATELGVYYTITPVGTAGANDYVEITGVQIDIGSVALPYKPNQPTYQGELAACQRYYFRQNWQATTAYAIFGTGAGNSTTQVRTDHVFPVPLRVAPTAIDYPTIGTSFTILKYDDTTAGTISATSNDGNISTTNIGRLNWTVTSAVANAPYYVRANNNSSVYIGWSAEL